MIELDFNGSGPSATGVDTVMNFGKHRGSTIIEVAEKAPDYLEWLLSKGDHWFLFEHTQDVKDALRQVRDETLSEALERQPLELTEHQEEAVDYLLACSSTLPIIRLEGGAGYGKSRTCSGLAVELIRKGYIVRGTAVSYVATQVLAQSLNPLGVNCATLARTMSLTKRTEDGVEIYEPSIETPRALKELLSPGNALIIDECSMISDEYARMFFDAAHVNGGLLILVGDSHQLPPVKQEHRSICCTPWDQGTCELSIPMRYDIGSPLHQVEQEARHRPDTLVSCGVLRVPSPQLRTVRDSDELIRHFVSNFEADPDAVHRQFHYKRMDVVAANNAIRSRLFGAEPKLVEEDERLMVMATSDTPYVNPKEKAALMQIDPPAAIAMQDRYYSGTSFRVTSMDRDVYTTEIGEETFQIPHWRVRFHGMEKPVRLIFAITDVITDPSKLGGTEYQAAFKAALQLGRGELLSKGGVYLPSDWKPFHVLKGDFLRVAYLYATSVHRAQGQTCDYAYCNPISLQRTDGFIRNPLTYVAVTRARKQLVTVA